MTDLEFLKRFELEVESSEEQDGRRMSDEEPDYMSDAFLAQCLPQDVKPGLKRV